MLQVAVDKRDNIKTKITVGDFTIGQVSLRRLGQVLDFAGIDPLRRMTKSVSEGRFNLHECDQAIPANNQVNLLVAGPPVSLEYLKTVLFEVVGRKSLEFLPLPDFLAARGTAGIR